MKNFIILFIFFTVQILFAQNSLKILVRDKEANIPLIGANVYIDSLKIGATTDVNGLAVLENVPNGDFIITAQYVGYESETLKISFPLVGENLPVTILLKNEAFKTQQITVTATRNNGIVKDIPIRVEVLGHEEVNEEIAIRPGNISKLLSETSGIHVQQTSVASGNVTFRLQGLPGGYTQMLKDGFPIYSGFSSGLSLLQIPPLDLRQVEVIKGSLSSLYGNGAIAGIVNLVSKEPAEKNSWSIILNQTHKQGTDISSYYSGTFDKIGITFLASQSMQNAVDVDKDGFSDIPQFSQTNLNPRFFYRFNTSGSLTRNLYHSWSEQGHGRQDFSSIFNYVAPKSQK
jgi:iron complex outermembrane receptor protein